MAVDPAAYQEKLPATVQRIVIKVLQGAISSAQQMDEDGQPLKTGTAVAKVFKALVQSKVATVQQECSGNADQWDQAKERLSAVLDRVKRLKNPTDMKVLKNNERVSAEGLIMSLACVHCLTSGGLLFQYQQLE